jgi:hypothetical protein
VDPNMGSTASHAERERFKSNDLWGLATSINMELVCARTVKRISLFFSVEEMPPK